MNVACPDCRAIFRVDPQKLPGAAVRARCAVCGGIILIDAPTESRDEFASEMPARAVAPPSELPPVRPSVVERPTVPLASAAPVALPEAHRIEEAIPSPGALAEREEAPPSEPEVGVGAGASSWHRPTPSAVIAPEAEPEASAPVVPSSPPAAATVPTPASGSAPAIPAAVVEPVEVASAPTMPGSSRPPLLFIPGARTGALGGLPSRGTAPFVPPSRANRNETPSGAPLAASPATGATPEPGESSTAETPSAGAAAASAVSSRPEPAPSTAVPSPAAPPSTPSVPSVPSVPTVPLGASVGAQLGGTVAEAPARRPINPFLANDPNAKARRLARALISDLVAYFPQRRDEGLRNGTLLELFDEEIKKSREEYVDQVGREFADSTPHFQDALNDILAGGAKIF